MNLPNLSNMLAIGQLRHIQAKYEVGPLTGPDELAVEFLTWQQRLEAFVKYHVLRPRLHKNAFYYYVFARTTYYDDVFLAAINEPAIAQIINIGCGGDTRSHRFASELRETSTNICECDQSEAILEKSTISAEKWPNNEVQYLEIDLNAGAWPNFSEFLDQQSHSPVQVILEGVSPYIETSSFVAFLRLLKERLQKDSVIAYDFKFAGADDVLGHTDQVHNPFRLSSKREEIVGFHNELGLNVDHLESSSELTVRVLGSVPLYEEDCLIKLRTS